MWAVGHHEKEKTCVGRWPSGEKGMFGEIAKFIPSKMRSEIVQELIREMGIRPLSREIDVNPKTVYNYKHGTSSPGDDTMGRILVLMCENWPVLLERHLSKLKDEFHNALEIPIEEIHAGEELTDRRPTSEAVEVEEVPKKEPVDSRPTLIREVGFNELFNEIGVSTPFERMKARNLLNTFGDARELSIDEIIEESGLSREAVEKYLGLLTSEGFIREKSSGSYGLIVRITGGD